MKILSRIVHLNVNIRHLEYVVIISSTWDFNVHRNGDVHSSFIEISQKQKKTKYNCEYCVNILTSSITEGRAPLSCC